MPFLLLATENLYHVPFIQYDTIQNLTVCPVRAAILPCNLLFSLESLQGLLMLPVQMKQEVMFFNVKEWMVNSIVMPYFYVLLSVHFALKCNEAGHSVQCLISFNYFWYFGACL